MLDLLGYIIFTCLNMKFFMVISLQGVEPHLLIGKVEVAIIDSGGMSGRLPGASKGGSLQLL